MRKRREPGRLTARPAKSSLQLKPGIQQLGLAADRDAFLFVPSATATKFLLLLHGAGGSGERFLERMQPFAENIDAIVLAPSSREPSWDVIRGGFGPDVELIDRALEYVFARASIDPRHLGVGGFSDGASYALSLGLTNGDLFSHVVAYSAGFVVAPNRRGKPPVFLSHGDEDEILPIERCGRPIAANLTREGYAVRFREFEGGHFPPPEIVLEGMNWFAK